MDNDYTSKWAKRRKFFYIFSFVGVLLIVSVYPLFQLFYKPPSCFDGKQNQMEFGVDCGGPCANLCNTQVVDVVVRWVKLFKVSSGVYSVAAYIENPNRVAGTDRLPYTFEVFDAADKKILNVSGEVFVRPRERVVVFEPRLKIEDEKRPASATITFGDALWKVMSKGDALITVKGERLSNTRTKPRLVATLLNNSVDDIFNIDVVAVVYDSKDEPRAVSSTFVDVLEGVSEKNIFFTWPTPISKLPTEGCTAPVDAVLVFDRSGSMGFEGGNPPQPLTDAKNAALAFVDNMQDVDQIGLVSFATTASEPIDRELTRTHELVKDAISTIAILSPAKEQHTNLGDGIEKATKELLSLRANKAAKKAIIILTDGVASRPLNPNNQDDTEYPSRFARDKAKIATESDISVYVIGLGDLVNEDFLRDEIASSPENYYKASTASELKSIYSDIAKTVCLEENFTVDIIARIKGGGEL